MSIQIDHSLFLPQIKTYSTRGRRETQFQDQIVDLGRDVLSEAQGWFDDAPWTQRPLEDFDTQRECRIELKRFIMNNISLQDSKRSWFIPNFVWVWIAQQVITYIVKMLIEHYWPDLIVEMGLEF